MYFNEGARRRRFATALSVVAAAVAVVTLQGAASAAETGYSVSMIQTGTAVGTSEVAVDPVTDTFYLADFLSDQVTVVNGATGAVTATITLGAHTEGIAVDPATDTIYVSEASDVIAVISGATDVVTATISNDGMWPRGIAVDSATDTVYVADEDNAAVTVIDGATATVTATISTGSGTRLGSGYRRRDRFGLGSRRCRNRDCHRRRG